MSRTPRDVTPESEKKMFVKSFDDENLQNNLDSDKLFQKFKENALIHTATNIEQSLQNFSDFLGISIEELQDQLGNERLNRYAGAYAETIKFTNTEEESSSLDADTKEKRESARKAMLEGLKLRVLRLVKLKLPSETFPKDWDAAKVIDTYTHNQGYTITLKQKDGYSLYEKSLNTTYPDTLANDLNLDESKKTQFINDYNKHRDSINNFDEMFFFHYHQKASSIKASYEMRAEKLKKGKGEKEREIIDTKLSTMKNNVDLARNEAFKQINKSCDLVFKECLKLKGVVKENGEIDLALLNKALDAKIKAVKKEGDQIFKKALQEKKCPIYSALARENTTAFGGDTLLVTKDGALAVEIKSTTITAHTKKKGPAVSEVTMKNGEQTLYQVYRTSHLASPSSKVEDVETVIRGFMDRRMNASHPMIYNLLTSIHSSDYSIVGFSDYWTNKQTKRLQILLDAQDKYNNTVTSSNDYFFTFNTPTNTYGNDITLDSSDPFIQRVARSNTIALAIILYGKDDQQVLELISKRDEHEAFKQKYNNFKDKKPVNNENPKEKLFLYNRFQNGDAATHGYAKATATCVGLCTKEDKFNLLVGCKSGLERTGNIIGRVAAYLRNKNNPQTDGISATKFVEDQKIDDISKDIDEQYNKNGVYNSGTCLTSCNDQGGNPKTKTSSGKGMKPNTNATEDAKVLPNMQNKNMSCLQAHKDKKFDESKDCIPSYILWAPKKIFFPIVWMARYREHAQLMAQIDSDLGCPPKSNFLFIKAQFQKNRSANSQEERGVSSQSEYRKPGTS